jgi:histidinol-phosphate aminotransferase
MTANYLDLASPGIRGLQPYQPGKPVEELERELGLKNIIKLASNENPLGPSDKVVAALNAALPDIARYPDGSAYELKHALAKKLGVGEKTLTIGNGSNDVLELLARVYLRPGTEVLVSEHSFVVYPLLAISLGADLKVVPAKNYGQDLEATLAAVTDKTRMVFIANPNNPTGTWLTEQAIRSFLQRIPDQVIVVLDEAYYDYVEEAEYPDGIALSREFPNLVITRTFSKAYGLAALRIGFSISHPDMADMMNRVRQPFNVNALSLVAALEALKDTDYLAKVVGLNREGLRYLERETESLGLGFIPSVGNFLTIDFGRDATPIYDALLREGVIVRPIGVYGLPNHLRVTVGLKEENERLIKSLKKILAGE